MILYMMRACILPVLCIAVFPAEGGKVGKYDGLMGRYLSNRERFADLMNGIMFDGKQMIDPKSLEREAGDYFETEGSLEADQSKVERKSQGKYRRVQRRYRDLKMRSRQNGQFRIFALENQSVVDYTMPLRCMEYDFLDYQEQLRQAAQQADEMVKAAQQKIKELRQVTNDYVDDAMKRTEDAIAQALSEIRESRSKFRALVNPQQAKPSPIIEDV